MCPVSKYLELTSSKIVIDYFGLCSDAVEFSYSI